MTVYELARTKFGKSPANEKFIETLMKSISNLPNEMIKRINYRYYDQIANKNVKYLFKRDDIENFFLNYVHKLLLFEQLSEKNSRSTVRKYYKRFNFKEIELGGKLDVFISKNESKKLIILCSAVSNVADNSSIKIYGEVFEYKSMYEAMEILNLSLFNIKKLIHSSILEVVDGFNGVKYFEENHLLNVQEKQLLLINEFEKQYYTSFQIEKKYGLSFANYTKQTEEKIRRPITKKDIPVLLSGFYGPQVKKLYDKGEVDKLWEDYNLYNNMNRISLDNPFDDFVNKVEIILKVSFTENQTNTKTIWYQYVRKILFETQMKDRERIGFMVNQFARNTDVIFKIFKHEIYYYSSNDINLLFLNSDIKINRSYQRDFYLFLKQMRNSFLLYDLPSPFKIDEINDPRSFEKIKINDTSIYFLEEYQALYEFVNKVEYHKKNALEDTLTVLNIKDTTKYKHYDSCWLYIIILLTNNWRHSTVITQIPRVDLSDTKIENLEWLMENNPTIEDANNIIFQIGRYVTKINKTGVEAEGIFTIGEPLKIAFATAISICELRTQILSNNSLKLINLSGTLLPKYNPHKDFFKEFISDFRFENRKMNRTLTTLIWSVLRHKGKGLIEAQVSRSHLQEQTTIKHYIKLTDGQVEKLVMEIFQRDQFGFIPQLLSSLLFGKETNNSIETIRINSIQNNFGEAMKVEVTAGLVNKLSIEMEQVANYLKELNLEELKKIYSDMLIGTLPSKQRYYQCIFSKCKFENDFGERPPCGTCTFSIINVYALSNIMDTYICFMEKINNEFDEAIIGEKQKLANHFYLLHRIVDQARNTFGNEVVNSFIDGGTKRIKSLGEKLTPRRLKGYITEGIIREE